MVINGKRGGGEGSKKCFFCGDAILFGLKD